MRCSKCGNNDAGCAHKKEGTKFFFDRMRTSFKDYSNLPCHVREVFKRSKFLPAKAPDGDLYMFKLKRDGVKTCIVGVDYEMFLEEYDMGHNNNIKFEFVKNDGYFSMNPFDTEGSIIEKVNWIEAYEEHLIGDEGGMKLKPHQMDNINTCIAEHGSGLGGIFVHRMTTTDILNNGLHIASVLGVRCRGTTTLVMDDENDINDTDYYTTADSRIRFKTGWPDSAEAFNIEVGDTVLIMFHMIESVFQISFDYI